MNTETQSNNKRIAKNTFLLYLRMLLLMVVSLYTSRVTLNALGVSDYGIYSVVGGVVVMFTMISGSLSNAISRFLTYELGKGEIIKLRDTFCASVTIQIVIAVTFIIVAETLGLWFVNTQLVIPEERLISANWVYQFSILNFAINLISVPYNASIIAHEKMSAFAYISIFEAFGKLVVAWTIMISPFDKLVFYAALLVLIAIIVRFVYGYYCSNNFDECKYHFLWDRELLAKMFGFAGWNMFGVASGVLRDQGGNILINIFFGPAVNSANAIAHRVNQTLYGFVSNFMMALNPQITKSYARDDRHYMFSLINMGARFSFYLLFLMALPIMLKTDLILELWLKLVPEHTSNLVRLTLLYTMSECISLPLMTAMLATGKIRNYQIVVGGLQTLNIPLVYLVLKYGFPVECVLVISVIVSQMCLAARLYMLRKMIGLKVSVYLTKVYFNVLSVSLVSCIVPFTLNYILEDNLMNFFVLCAISVLSSVLSILFVGCSSDERIMIKEKIIKRTIKKWKK